MLLINSNIATAKKNQRILQEKYSYNKKVEDKIEELNRDTIIDYYLHGTR